MPNPLLAIMGISSLSGIMGARSESSAANRASHDQRVADQRGIGAIRSGDADYNQNIQNAIIYAQGLMNPYIKAGTSALGQMLNLNGTNGDDAQQTAINTIQNSSQFTSLRDQGYDALNQNAAATGGLRGGNQEAALGQFAPNMLNTLIQQQLANYEHIAANGQQAASGLAGMVGNLQISKANPGQDIANLYSHQGAAQAGGDIARGNAYNSMWGSFGGAANYGFGQAMQPQQMMNPVTGAMQDNPSALPGGLFGSWGDRKSTRLNSSHSRRSRMPSSA